jgi:hypothetical protein
MVVVVVLSLEEKVVEEALVVAVEWVLGEVELVAGGERWVAVTGGVEFY